MGDNLPKILLIEDDEGLKNLNKIILSIKYGLEVDSVRTSAEAVSAFFKKNYDVVFMDIGQSYLDGEYKENIRNVGGFSIPDLNVAFSGVLKLRSMNPKTVFIGYSGNNYTKETQYLIYFEKIFYKGDCKSDYLKKGFIPYLRELGYDIREGLKL